MANGITIDDINKYFQDIYTIKKGKSRGTFTMPTRDIRNLSDEQLIHLLNQGSKYWGRHDAITTPEMDAELEQALLNLASERGAQTEQRYHNEERYGEQFPFSWTFIPPREGDLLSGSEIGFDEMYAIKAAQAGRPNHGIGENIFELRDTNYPFKLLASIPETNSILPAHSLIDDLIAKHEQGGVSTEETAHFENLIDLLATKRKTNPYMF